MYIVSKYFTDLQDNNHPYEVGDDFPRKGLEVDKERIAELSSENNKRGKVLIKAVKANPQPKKAEPKSEAPAE